MYCSHCGKENPDGAVFCSSCGQLVAGPGRQESDVQRRFNNAPGGAAPKQMMPAAFIGLCAAAVIVIVVTAVVVFYAAGAAGHDLAGTYYASEFFPVDVITFQKNGTFTAVSYAGYTETYQGKYSKSLNGEYKLRFTGGSSAGGSPVTQFEASSMDSQYEMRAEKAGGNALRVRIVPKIGYYAWSGTAVYFYMN